MIVLAVDIGSTTAKAQRFDENGQPLGQRVRVPVPIAPDGTADAVAFAETVDGLIDTATDAECGPAPDIVAVATAWHGLVGLDAAEQPITQLTTWSDTRAANEARELRARLADRDDAHDRTGAPIHPSFPPARMAWLRAHDPHAYARVARWCSIAELLETRWFGFDAPVSLSIASGSGLWCQRDARWDIELCDLLGLAPTQLGAVSDDARPKLSPRYAQRWPSLSSARWRPALGDGACSAVGSGALPDNNIAALSIGTSAAVRVITTTDTRWKAPLPHALFAYALDETRSVVGAARSNAGNLVQWAQRVLRLPDGDVVAAATASTPHSVTVPHADSSFAGERSPLWPDHATGSITGLTDATTSVDILRSLLVAAGQGLAGAVAALEQWCGRVSIAASGGYLHEPGWRQLLANALGRPVTILAVDEVSARGAALAALEHDGIINLDRLPPPPGSVEQPDEARSAWKH